MAKFSLLLIPCFSWKWLVLSQMRWNWVILCQWWSPWSKLPEVWWLPSMQLCGVTPNAFLGDAYVGGGMESSEVHQGEPPTEPWGAGGPSCSLSTSQRSPSAAGCSPSPDWVSVYIWRVMENNWAFLQVCPAGLKMANQIHLYKLFWLTMIMVRLKYVNQNCRASCCDVDSQQVM